MSAASGVAWKRAHPSAAAEQRKIFRQAIREETIVAYGGKCVECGEEDHDLLEIDHKNGKGNDERDKLFGYGHQSPGGWNFYIWLKKQGWPKDEYQCMCGTCNRKKGGQVTRTKRIPYSASEEDSA